MNRPLVYLACPITAGNRNLNYFNACETERQLMVAGFSPQNPAHTAVLPFAWEKEYPHAMWLDCCFPLIERMDAVLRIPGYSVGADAECEHAMKHGVPVVYSIEELEAWREKKESVLCQ
jgi:hypothetical protein